MRTLLLDTAEWDLTLDASRNIAVASNPYALAQDAASAIRTYLGEVYYDTTLGIPYRTQIFGKTPQLSLLKAFLIQAAKTVPEVTGAQAFITELQDRVVRGQVQVTSAQTGQPVAAAFTVLNPQGA